MAWRFLLKQNTNIPTNHTNIPLHILFVDQLMGIFLGKLYLLAPNLFNRSIDILLFLQLYS